MTFKPFPLIALCITGLSGACVAPLAAVGVAGVAGVFATQEYRDNSAAIYLDWPQAVVYEEALSLLEAQAPGPVAIDRDAWTMSAEVEAVRYSIRVTGTGDGKARLSIGARKYGLWNREVADAWITRLQGRLDQRPR